MPLLYLPLLTVEMPYSRDSLQTYIIYKGRLETRLFDGSYASSKLPQIVSFIIPKCLEGTPTYSQSYNKLFLPHTHTHTHTHVTPGCYTRVKLEENLGLGETVQYTDIQPEGWRDRPVHWYTKGWRDRTVHWYTARGMERPSSTLIYRGMERPSSTLIYSQRDRETVQYWYTERWRDRPVYWYTARGIETVQYTDIQPEGWRDSPVHWYAARGMERPSSTLIYSRMKRPSSTLIYSQRDGETVQYTDIQPEEWRDCPVHWYTARGMETVQYTDIQWDGETVQYTDIQRDGETISRGMCWGADDLALALFTWHGDVWWSVLGGGTQQVGEPLTLILSETVTEEPKSSLKLYLIAHKGFWRFVLFQKTSRNLLTSAH